MAQFRVEFVLDKASGWYLAELYDPEDETELIVRTEPMYPTQAAAVLGLVQLFKDALQRPPRRPPAKKKPAKKRKAAPRRRNAARKRK